MTEDELIEKLTKAARDADASDLDPEGTPFLGYRAECRRFLAMMKAYEEAKKTKRLGYYDEDTGRIVEIEPKP